MVFSGEQRLGCNDRYNYEKTFFSGPGCYSGPAAIHPCSSVETIIALWIIWPYSQKAIKSYSWMRIDFLLLFIYCYIQATFYHFLHILYYFYFFNVIFCRWFLASCYPLLQTNNISSDHFYILLYFFFYSVIIICKKQATFHYNIFTIYFFLFHFDFCRWFCHSIITVDELDC